ncbi:MAG: bactofilin family protein [Burkholderiales bacterium]
MFFNRRKSVRIEDGNLNTLVDRSVTLGLGANGGLVFHFEKSLRFDGRLDGSLQGTPKRDCVVVIGPSAVINGSVSAHSVVVLGTVHGNVTAEYIEIRESARVSGDVSYVRLEIHQGSHVEGRMFRIEGSGQPDTSPQRPAQTVDA